MGKNRPSWEASWRAPTFLSSGIPRLICGEELEGERHGGRGRGTSTRPVKVEMGAAPAVRTEVSRGGGDLNRPSGRIAHRGRRWSERARFAGTLAAFAAWMELGPAPPHGEVCVSPVCRAVDGGPWREVTPLDDLTSGCCPLLRYAGLGDWATAPAERLEPAPPSVSLPMPSCPPMTPPSPRGPPAPRWSVRPGLQRSGGGVPQEVPVPVAGRAVPRPRFHSPGGPPVRRRPTASVGTAGNPLAGGGRRYVLGVLELLLQLQLGCRLGQAALVETGNWREKMKMEGTKKKS